MSMRRLAAFTAQRTIEQPSTAGHNHAQSIIMTKPADSRFDYNIGSDGRLRKVTRSDMGESAD